MKTIRLAIVICLMLTVAACSSSNKDSQNKETESSAATSTQSAGEKPASSDKVKITKEQYNKIENGMTYQEVVEIVGGEGEIITETGEKGTDLYGIGVLYEGKGGVGANASLIFLGDKLQTKSQIGLE